MSKSFIIKIIIICLLTINAYAIEKIVLFGDSLMAGYGLSDDNSLPVVLEENLMQRVIILRLLMAVFLVAHRQGD